MPDSVLPVTLLITAGYWTLQQINAPDVYSVLYKILYEGERGTDSSMAISESDMNIMEDLWGILAQYCYKHGKSLPSNASLMVGKRVLQG
ncbi:hypothetical protein AVEN_260962-1 [Araneus ventricosus]|uniref:Uncharacterized protein n=1 Tax=Araneus ventricosus TaxID=182803 RepID=A0A4Y2G441_ARAVE|nr:hypothetical protein AVEN_260962-1 [Araneus ventricosus]